MPTEGARNRFAEQQSSYSAQERLREVGEMVCEHPASSAAIAFGLGFGVGLALGAMLGEPSHRAASRRAHGYGPYLDSAERLGRQIMEAVQNALPESLTHRK